ncbi:MAG: hypothetical protein AAFN18_23315 [Cyanobacteria bacterium J06554_6]
MLNLSARLRSKPINTLLICVGLVSLVSCSTSEVSTPSPDGVSEAPAEVVSADAPTEAVTTGETAPAPQPAPAVSTSNPQPESKTETVSDSAVNLEVGMQYDDARAILMQQGWVPGESPEPGPYGIEREAYDAGFTEVVSCSATGLGPCRFEFGHATENKVLAVITTGGSRLEIAEWSVETPVASTPATPANTVAQQPQIPLQFQGEWDASLEGCAAPYSDGRLTITSNRLEFWESSGPVQSVVMQGDRQITVTTELSSEGSTFTDTKTFHLSDDGSVLTMPETGSVRYRCP